MRNDWKIGLFGNLISGHGFGVSFFDTHQMMPGIQVDHFDLHACPASEVTGQNIQFWRTNLAGIPVQTLWAGFPNDDYSSVAATKKCGLVPLTSRADNCKELRRVIDLAKALDAQAVGMHIGHLTGRDAEGYNDLTGALKRIADESGLLGGIVLETGQESPEVLLQFLEDVDSDNVGINFLWSSLEMQHS